MTKHAMTPIEMVNWLRNSATKCVEEAYALNNEAEEVQSAHRLDQIRINPNFYNEMGMRPHVKASGLWAQADTLFKQAEILGKAADEMVGLDRR